ncbi:hypothetical protein ACFRAE_17125 [Sphingobacterium sp. HJSM2_6]|uniref:hypothetical protein n=1 Tax=Sphingobacterium sp. HJSM2_6 TaxID=3366264 RepID=UPI003BBCCDA9
MMFGIKINWQKKEYKISEPILLSLNQDVLGFQSENLCVWKVAEVGIEFDLIVSDFDKTSDRVSENPEGSYIDLSYKELVHNEEWEWEKKIEEFKRLEIILRKEGKI